MTRGDNQFHPTPPYLLEKKVKILKTKHYENYYKKGISQDGF